MTRIFDECLKAGYAFIFDGTLSHENGLRNIQKAVRFGYEVYIIYIVQDAQMAWELTQARELIKKRSIEKAGFIETCNKINANLLKIFETFHSQAKFNFWILNKQGASGMENASAIIHGPGLDRSKEIEKALQTSYNLSIT